MQYLQPDVMVLLKQFVHISAQRFRFRVFAVASSFHIRWHKWIPRLWAERMMDLKVAKSKSGKITENLRFFSRVPVITICQFDRKLLLYIYILRTTKKICELTIV